MIEEHSYHEIDLVDRDEIRYKEEWVCYEILTIECPKCGRPTFITVTYQVGTEYHHSAYERCTVPWTEEPVPPGFERVKHKILTPRNLQ